MSIKNINYKDSDYLFNLDANFEKVQAYKVRVLKGAKDSVGTILGGSGSDKIKIHALGANVSGDLKGGNNKVDIRSEHVVIDMIVGDGKNVLSNKGDNSKIDFVSGNNRDVFYSKADKLSSTIDLGGGDDFVKIIGSDIDLNADFADGNDRFTFKGDSFTSEKGLDFGDGANKISIKANEFDADLNLGSGADKVLINGNEFSGEVKLGGGADKVFVKGSGFSGDVKLGEGSDFFKYTGNFSSFSIEGTADGLDNVLIKGNHNFINLSNLETVRIFGASNNVFAKNIESIYIDEMSQFRLGQGSAPDVVSQNVNDMIVESGGVFNLSNSYLTTLGKDNQVQVSSGKDSEVDLGKGNDLFRLSNTYYYNWDDAEIHPMVFSRQINDSSVFENLKIDGGLGHDVWQITEDLNLIDFSGIVFDNFEQIELINRSLFKLSDNFDFFGDSITNIKIVGDGLVDVFSVEWDSIDYLLIDNEEYGIFRIDDLTFEIPYEILDWPVYLDSTDPIELSVNALTEVYPDLQENMLFIVDESGSDIQLTKELVSNLVLRENNSDQSISDNFKEMNYSLTEQLLPNENDSIVPIDGAYLSNTVFA